MESHVFFDFGDGEGYKEQKPHYQQFDRTAVRQRIEDQLNSLVRPPHRVLLVHTFPDHAGGGVTLDEFDVAREGIRLVPYAPRSRAEGTPTGPMAP